MKYAFSLWLAALLVFSACDDSESPSVNSGLGLVKKIEGFVNDAPIDDITELSYDNSQNVVSIQVIQGNFSSRTYDVAYTGGEVSTLTITREFINSGDILVEVYDVDQQGDQIILSSADVQGRYILTATDGYIDTYEDYLDQDNSYFNEAHFVRDAANNIDTVSYFTTNASDTNLLTWQYTFSAFEEEPSLNAAFNPVFNYSSSLYDPFIGLALGLRVSDDVPLYSSYWDASGTFNAENVSASFDEVSGDLLMKLGYTIEFLPDNSYHLEFEYY